MHRRIALLLFLVSPAMYAMENNKLLTLFDSVKSNIVARFTQEPDKSPMEALEIDKNKFEEEMQFLSEFYKENLRYGIQATKTKTWAWATGRSVERFLYDERFFRFFLSNYPDGKSSYDFLKYCYYQKYNHGQREYNLRQLVDCPDLFDKCKESQINGFSALGAAFLAKDVHFEEQYKFLELLMQYGFEWTEKDKALIQLKFYNTMTLQEKQTMILLLCDHQEGYLSELPNEVRKYIVAYMVYSLKQERAPLENYTIIRRILLCTDM